MYGSKISSCQFTFVLDLERKKNMYLIVGANGFLGSYIMKKVLETTKEKITAVARNIKNLPDTDRVTWISCDISDVKETNMLARRINAIGEPLNVIFLAAYHHPDQVEKHPKAAWQVNIIALAYFLNVIENVRCFFYPSTDSVYGNGDVSYHFQETDSLKPVNRYGRQKAAAEAVVNAYGYQVVRFPFLIAPSLVPEKEHFYDQIVKVITNGGTMEMFADSFRSSLDFDTAAGILVQLVENYSDKMPGILNIAGDDDLSKYDIGLRIANKLHVPTERIIPITMDDAGGIFQAKRAQSTLMDNSKVKKYLGLQEIKLKL